jgi:hypothetical protein
MRNDKIEMNMEILNVIHAVLDYTRFISSDNRIKNNKDFDWYKTAEDYYRSLTLPDGMNHNIADFERVLTYSCPSMKALLKEIDDTEENKLNKFAWK